jgi:hypothetical protein
MTDLLISLIKIKDPTLPFTKRLIYTPTSDRCDNAKLGKMRSDRIDHRSLLTDEEMARAMEHQAALLFRRLRLHEPHVWPDNGPADRLSISGTERAAIARAASFHPELSEGRIVRRRQALGKAGF